MVLGNTQKQKENSNGHVIMLPETTESNAESYSILRLRHDCIFLQGCLTRMEVSFVITSTDVTHQQIANYIVIYIWIIVGCLLHDRFTVMLLWTLYYTNTPKLVPRESCVVGNIH